MEGLDRGVELDRDAFLDKLVEGVDPSGAAKGDSSTVQFVRLMDIELANTSTTLVVNNLDVLAKALAPYNVERI